MLLVLTDNQDFNSKLRGLINELRGELGAVLRGSRDARDRLLKSKCTAFSFFGHRANLLRTIGLVTFPTVTHLGKFAKAISAFFSETCFARVLQK